MPRLVVLVALVGALVVVAFGAVIAQDGTPSPGAGGESCPTGMGMPDASPMASPEMTMSASPTAMIASPIASPAGETCTVTIQDFAFMSANIEIAVGTTVTWTNNDTAPHTVTTDDRAIDSGRIDQGVTFSHTFTEPGAYPYHCDFHPNMIGTIVVR